MNWVYILLCSNHAYYTGWTNDLDARWQAHVSGQGAKYTRAFPPLKIVYTETYEDRHAAMAREVQIKRMSRAQKEELIRCRTIDISKETGNNRIRKGDCRK